jgi:hypothetical protein|uniref:hypothetical protein n=1 Tax=Prosthecobacter sp. TaxID=1965333 RepID=UPI0037834EE7
MNVLKILLVLLVFVSGAHANQPKLTEANDRLENALRQILNSAEGKTKAHLEKAKTALQMAQSSLETAAKNKGSHTHVAIEKVQAAIKEIDKLQGTSSNRDKTVEEIKSAIEEVKQARRAGNR